MSQELQIEKPKALKRLVIDKIAVIKGQRGYYVVSLNLDKGVNLGIIETKKIQ